MQNGRADFRVYDDKNNLVRGTEVFFSSLKFSFQDKLLVNCIYDVYIYDILSYKPLYYACLCGHVSVVLFLRDAALSSSSTRLAKPELRDDSVRIVATEGDALVISGALTSAEFERCYTNALNRVTKRALLGLQSPPLAVNFTLNRDSASGCDGGSNSDPNEPVLGFMFVE